MATEETTANEQERNEDVEAEEEKATAEPEEKAEKTLSQSQVDELISKRLKRLKDKQAKEMESVKAEYEEQLKDQENLKAEIESLKAEKQRDEWKSNAAKEFNVPADLLRGNTEEELKEHAKQIKEAMGTFKTDLGSNSHAEEKPTESSRSAFAKRIGEAVEKL